MAPMPSSSGPGRRWPHASLQIIVFCALPPPRMASKPLASPRLGLSASCWSLAAARTRRVPRRAHSHDQALRYEHDNSAKWDPKNRARTKSPEEAERILKITGRLPRPLRLSAVKLGLPPLKKTIVATAKERRAAAEMTGIYSVSRRRPQISHVMKDDSHQEIMENNRWFMRSSAGFGSCLRLQARLLLHRELHPVWGYERVMIYGSMLSEYMVPDTFTNDPMELTVPLKFKAAFREDAVGVLGRHRRSAAQAQPLGAV